MVSLSVRRAWVAGGFGVAGGAGVVGGFGAAAAQGHPGQQAGRQQAQRGQFVTAEAGDEWIERGHVVASQVADRGPRPDPEGGADRVQGQEPGEAHPGQAGDDPVGLTQHVDEAGQRDDLAAVPGEELLRPGHPVRREQHVPAEPGQQPAPAAPADEPAEAVARHGGHERDHRDRHDVEPPGAGVDRGGDQHGLARDRETKALQQEQATHGRVPVPVQVRSHGREQTGQCGHPTAWEPGEGMNRGRALTAGRRDMAQSSGRSIYSLVELLHECRC
jgi:hypothetical protein